MDSIISVLHRNVLPVLPTDGILPKTPLVARQILSVQVETAPSLLQMNLCKLVVLEICVILDLVTALMFDYYVTELLEVEMPTELHARPVVFVV